MKMLVVEDKKICDEYPPACCGVSKFLSIFFIFLILIVPFVYAQVNDEKIEELNNKFEGGADKLSEIIEKQQDDKGYLLKEMQKLILNNPVAKAMDGFFKQINTVFFVLFGMNYELTFKMLIVFILWVWLFFKMGDALEKGTYFGSFYSHLLALLGVVGVAQIGIFRNVADFFIWIVSAKEAWLYRIVAVIIILVVVVFLDYLGRSLSKSLDASKKSREEAKTMLNQRVIEKYTEGLQAED
mgnify:FL=1